MERWAKAVVPKLAEDSKASAAEEANMIARKSSMGRSLEEGAMQVGGWVWWGVRVCVH